MIKKDRDHQMKELIKDFNILNYLHDLISYSKKNEEFFSSNLYIELHEKNIITTFKYLKRTIFTTITFIGVVFTLKTYFASTISQLLLYSLILLVAILYGKLIIMCKNDVVCLNYQMKAKMAAQFALDHYNYEQFVIFIDQYLSEMSSTDYINRKTMNNKKEN